MSKVILLRHGQSKWNLVGRFQGHKDIELTEQGMEEAVAVGEELREMEIDQVFMSPLKRVQDTVILAMGQEYYLDRGAITARELLERHYGDLAGLTHKEAEETYGKEQVNQWRNSYDVRPPNGECLRDVAERVLPFFRNEVKPLLNKGKNVLIVSHRNPIRALIQYFDIMPDDKVGEIVTETATPIVYEFKRGDVKRIA